MTCAGVGALCAELKGHLDQTGFMPYRCGKNDQRKGNLIMSENTRNARHGYWGKLKRVKGVMKKVWIGPMTRDEMILHDDTYRHNYSDNIIDRGKKGS